MAPTLKVYPPIFFAAKGALFFAAKENKNIASIIKDNGLFGVDITIDLLYLRPPIMLVFGCH